MVLVVRTGGQSLRGFASKEALLEDEARGSAERCGGGSKTYEVPRKKKESETSRTVIESQLKEAWVTGERCLLTRKIVFSVADSLG